MAPKKISFLAIEDKLLCGFNEISKQASLVIDNDANDSVKITVKKGDSLLLHKNDDNSIVITYSHDVEFFRAVSMLSEFIDGKACAEQKPNDAMLCYMADMSRNAVYNIPSAKRMIRYLALMGFNSLMLYTEDTYEISEYPYFGHMRGRFSKEELREIDDYAFLFGIEVIPCVQALAHLSTALRWPDFNGYKDTGDILMVGEEKTYKFIESVIKTCAECFRSRKINLGMDEAHMLGRGNYLLKNGYRPAHELMLEHLDRVVSMCNEAGFSPMIWSDMFFRMAFNGTYRVAEGEIAPEIIARVPAGLTLIYWDYYSLDSKIFSHMLDCHLKFNNPVVFAGGAWKWSGFAPHNRFSLVSTEMQLDVCKDKHIENMIVTAWGDNGGEASQFAPLPVLLYFAERAYCGKISNEHLEKRAAECFGIGYEQLLCLDTPNELPGITMDSGHPLNPSRYLLYNDPLEGLMDRHMDPLTVSNAFKRNSEKLSAFTSNEDFGYIYETLAALCDLLSSKCDLSIKLREAYKSNNKDKLEAISKEITEIIDKLNIFILKFRNQWYKENKTFGFGNHEIRLGGLKERLLSAQIRIDEYIKGKVHRIEELEQPCLSINGRKDSSYISYQSWISNATVGVM